MSIQQHGIAAVVTDDFGNAVRYKDDELEDYRNQMDFYLGYLIPHGAQIKTDMIFTPFVKFDGDTVIVFDPKIRDWQPLETGLTKKKFFEKFENKFQFKDYSFVRKEEWNFTPVGQG